MRTFSVSSCNARLIAAAVALLLSGCGGGGADSTASTDAAAAPVVTAMPADTAPVDVAPAAPTATDVMMPSEQALAAKPVTLQAVDSSTSVFIDSANGSDSNAGTQAAPWKTLAKLKSVQLAAGQNVFLACSGVWRESVALTASNLSSSATITSYGSTCTSSNRPRIVGADNYSGGWTRSGNIWSRAVPAGTPKITRLFIGSDGQRTAQWPNFGGFGAEYAKADPASPASRTALTVASANRAALTGRLTAGATLQVRSDPWYVDTQTVSGWNSSTGVITLSGNTTYTMEGGDGYVLQDQAWMLDTSGEFFHDTVANKLYVFPSTAAAQLNLNSFVVEGSVRDTALSINGVPGVSLQGIVVGRTRKTGLLIEDSLGAVVNGSDLSGNGDTGVRVVLHATPPVGAIAGTISNNTVNDNWRFGIDTTYGTQVTISGNVVTDTGTVGYAGNSSAAVMAGSANKVLSNTIRRTAYLGISFSGYGGTRVAGNLVTQYCLRLTDCAAIYTWNGSTAPLATTGMSSIVEQNRLLKVTPNVEGAVGGGLDLVSGIYLDNFSRGVTVRNNIVSDVPYGIIVHNSSNNVFDHNSVWLSTVASLKLSMDITGSTDWMTSNTFSSNTLVPALTAGGTYPTMPALGQSLAVQFGNLVSGSGSLSSGSNLFTGNTIVALNDPTVIYATVSGGGISGATLMDAAAWKRTNPSDGNVATPALFSLFQLSLGPELIADGSFDPDLGLWTSWFALGSLGNVLASPMTGCSGNCAVMKAGSINDSLMSPSFNLAVGVPHITTFTATLGAAATIGTPYFGRTSLTGGSVIAAPGLSSTTSLTGVAGTTINYEGFLVPSSSDTARLNLKVATAGASVGFDRVSLKAVLGYSLSKVSDYAVSAHANVGTGGSIACADLGWPSGCTVKDVNGTTITMPMYLAPSTSALLLRTNSSWAK